MCSDLIFQGYTAYLTSAGCAYDLVVDVGSRLIRVQVKSTSKITTPDNPMKPPKYVFQTRKNGRGSERVYTASTFDMFALVAADSRQIAYVPVVDSLKTTYEMFLETNPNRKSARVMSEFPFTKALEEILKGKAA